MERSALCQAALDGNIEGARHQIKIGAPLDGSDCGKYDDEAPGCITGAPYYTPLGEAARMGHPEIVTALLDAGAPIDGIDYRNETPLILAAMQDRPETVDLLIKRGANIHHVGCMGTALAATQPGWRDNAVTVAQRLLDAGASPLVAAFDMGDTIDQWLESIDKHGKLARKIATRYFDAFHLVLPHAGAKASKVKAAIKKMEPFITKKHLKEMATKG